MDVVTDHSLPVNDAGHVAQTLAATHPALDDVSDCNVYRLPTRFGYGVDVFKGRESWWALLRDVSREVVPVHCLHGDVESTLRALRRNAASLSKSRLHVHIRNGKRSVVVGSLGLAGGSSPSAAFKAQDFKEDCENDGLSFATSVSLDRSLSHFIADHGIQKTDDLIDRINEHEDPHHRELLIDLTFKAYHPLVADTKRNDLRSEDMREYALLTELRTKTSEGRMTMRTIFFDELMRRCDKMPDTESMADVLLISLANLDVDIFQGDAHQLLHMANILVKKIIPINTAYCNESAHWQCKVMCTIRLLVEKLFSIEEFRRSRHGSATLFGEIKTMIDRIAEASSRCFPVHHLALLLKFSVEHFMKGKDTAVCESEPDVSWIDAERQTGNWNVCVETIFFGIDTALLDANNAFRKPLFGRRTDWCLVLQWLNAFALKANRDPRKLTAYWSNLKSALTKRVFEKDAMCHLMFGIIDQLTMLSLSGSLRVKKEARRQLELLKDRKKVSMNEDVIRRLHDRIALLIEDADALDWNGTPRKGGSKPQSSFADGQSENTDVLFKTLWPMMFTVRGRPIESKRSSILKSLISGYQRHLRPVHSMHQTSEDYVWNMTFRLTKTESMRVSSIVDEPDERREQQSDVRTEVGLVDLTRSIQHEPRVIVKGIPGIGKSALLERLALDWSLERWGSNFEALFVLHVSDVIDSWHRHPEGHTTVVLAHAILSSLRRYISEEYPPDRLLMFIKRELKKIETLVMLDGMEEAKDRSRAIVDTVLKSSKHRQYHLLLLSRPGSETRDVGPVYELLPLSEDAVYRRLDPYPKIQARFRQCPNLSKLHRNPLHLQILLGHAEEIEKDQRQRSNRWFYDNVVRAIVQRCESKLEMPAMNTTDAFKALGKAAIQGLKRERGRVSELEVETGVGYLCSEPLSLERRGLLIRHEDGDVEFADDVLQQHFAGKQLAKWFAKEGNGPQRAKQTLEDLRFGAKYGEVLKTAGAELGRLGSVQGMGRMLKALKAGDNEIRGFWSLRNKMRCLRQYILENAPDEADFAAIEREANIALSLKARLEAASVENKEELGSDALLKALVELLKRFPRVIACSKPALLETALKKIQNERWNVHPMAVEALAWIVHASDEHNEPWIQAIRDGLRSRCGMSQRVIKHMRVMGTVASRCVPRLLELLSNVSDARRNAVCEETVVELLRSCPGEADAYVGLLAEICTKEEAGGQGALFKALPDILNGDVDVASHLLDVILTEERIDDPSKLTIGEITALGICVEMVPSKMDGIVESMLPSWKTMNADKQKTVGEMFVRFIQTKPEHAVRIIAHLLKEDDGDRPDWTFEMSDVVLPVLSHVPPTHAAEVLSFLRDNCQPEEKSHLFLKLKALKHAVRQFGGHIREHVRAVVKAFDNDDVLIRTEAFSAVASIAKYQPGRLGFDLYDVIVKAMEMEIEILAQRAGMEAVAEMLAIDAGNTDLIDVCRRGLEDDDIIVRQRAVDGMVKAVVTDIENDNVLLDALVHGYKNASGVGKLGIVHCLNAVVECLPDAIERILPVLFDAVNEEEEALVDEAFAALATVASTDRKRIESLVARLKSIEHEAVTYPMVKALTVISDHDANGTELLISYVRQLSEPETDEEWNVYFQALASAVQIPTDAAKPLMDILLNTSKTDAPAVRQMREAAAERLDYRRWLEWYEATKSEAVLNQICRRCCNAPGTFVKKCEKGRCRWYYIEDDVYKIEKHIENKTANRLLKYFVQGDGSGMKSSRRRLVCIVPFVVLFLYKTVFPSLRIKQS